MREWVQLQPSSGNPYGSDSRRHEGGGNNITETYGPPYKLDEIIIIIKSDAAESNYPIPKRNISGFLGWRLSL